MRLRCPRCGAKGIFRRWFSMAETCPTCDLKFERTEGYWTGSMAINMVVAEGVFVAVLVGGIVATSPDPNWGLIMAVSIASNIVVPVLFFPVSRLVWVVIDRRLLGDDWSGF